MRFKRILKVLAGISLSLLILGITFLFAASNRDSNRFEFLNDPDFADRSEWLLRDGGD